MHRVEVSSCLSGIAVAEAMVISSVFVTRFPCVELSWRDYLPLLLRIDSRRMGVAYRCFQLALMKNLSIIQVLILVPPDPLRLHEIVFRLQLTHVEEGELFISLCWQLWTFLVQLLLEVGPIISRSLVPPHALIAIPAHIYGVRNLPRTARELRVLVPSFPHWCSLLVYMDFTCILRLTLLRQISIVLTSSVSIFLSHMNRSLWTRTRWGTSWRALSVRDQDLIVLFLIIIERIRRLPLNPRRVFEILNCNFPFFVGRITNIWFLALFKVETLTSVPLDILRLLGWTECSSNRLFGDPNSCWLAPRRFSIMLPRTWNIKVLIEGGLGGSPVILGGGRVDKVLGVRVTDWFRVSGLVLLDLRYLLSFS